MPGAEREPAARALAGKAERDLLIARHTLELPDDVCPFDGACFHAQQCAEKYLKALLVHRGIEYPFIHDLVHLAELLPPKDGQLLQQLDLEGLTRFATGFRYEDTVAVGRTETEDAIQQAEGVRRVVREILGWEPAPEAAGRETAE